MEYIKYNLSTLYRDNVDQLLKLSNFLFILRKLILMNNKMFLHIECNYKIG